MNCLAVGATQLNIGNTLKGLNNHHPLFHISQTYLNIIEHHSIGYVWACKLLSSVLLLLFLLLPVLPLLHISTILLHLVFSLLLLLSVLFSYYYCLYSYCHCCHYYRPFRTTPQVSGALLVGGVAEARGAATPCRRLPRAEPA